MLLVAPNMLHPFLNLCPLPRFCSFSKEVNPTSPSLSLGWLCDLLWAIGDSRGHGVPVPSLGLRRPGVFPFALLFLLLPGWACWTLRYRTRAELPCRPNQSQTKHMTPNACCKLSQDQPRPVHVDWTLRTHESPKCSLFYVPKVEAVCYAALLWW